MAAPRLGSGERFRKLSGTLAARGAKDPDALAAWIGRRKYGAAKMGRLSHHSHATPMDFTVDAAAHTITHEHDGYREHTHNFARDHSGSYSQDSSRSTGSVAGTTASGANATLRTPANAGLQSAAGYSPGSAGVSVRGGAGGAGLSGQQRGVDLAQRLPVTGPSDVVVSRGGRGVVIRHRRGGDKIGEIFRTDGGQWTSAIGEDGQAGENRTHQRTALADLLGGWNRSAPTLSRAAQAPPLARPPEQTPLMEKYGIPAIRALATPVTSSSGGPRATMSSSDSDGDGDSGSNGLSPKGQGIYKKLVAKGWPAARALKFARNAQNMTGGAFRKAS